MRDSGDFTGRWIVGFQYQEFSNDATPSSTRRTCHPAAELQALSAIQQVIQAAQLVGPTMLHAAVIDGPLAQWVRPLEAF